MSVLREVTFHNTFSEQFPHFLHEALSPEVVWEQQLPNKWTYGINHHTSFRLDMYEQKSGDLETYETMGFIILDMSFP